MSHPAPANMLPGSYSALGYHSAQVARESGRTLPVDGSGDMHMRGDRPLLIAMARKFDRDNGIYQSIKARALDAIIGVGFLHQAATSDDELNERIERDWKAFAEEPEVRGMFDWQDIERASLSQIFDAGDLGVMRVADLEKFQFFEAEEIATPILSGTRSRLSRGTFRGGTFSRQNGNIIEQGVELDERRRPVAYHITEWGTGQRLYTGAVARSSSARSTLPGNVRAKSHRALAENFIMPANRRRYSDTRGIPVMQASFSLIHRLNDILDSEAISWQTLARFALLITREGSAEQAYQETDDDPNADSNTAELGDRIVELEKAIMMFGEEGESIRAIERSLPGDRFPESVRMFLRLAGLPFGLPLEVILLDYSKTNYTGARAALEQAWKMFICWQRFLKRRHHRPLYRWWMEWQLDAGKYGGWLDRNLGVPNVPGVFDHKWIAPEFPWIDQQKEAEAWGTRIDRGLATQHQALASAQMAYDEYIELRKREIATAKEAAAELGVDWRYLAGIPVSQTQSMKDDGDEGGQEGPEAPEETDDDRD